MDNTDKRPVIKLKRTTFDWILELAAFTFLLILIGMPLIYGRELPVKIPVHFNFAGEPDGYGSRSSLWILPLTGLFMYLVMTVLEAFPNIYNFPVKITPENAVTQYRLATRLIRILKTFILLIFSFISYQTIKTAMGNATGLGKVFLPLFLLFTFGIILIYVLRSLNNRQNN
jgi:uncharacterized membrane protein